MKCYRIREQSRVTFIMGNQIQSEEMNRDRMSCRIPIALVLIEGRKIGLTHVMGEEEYQLFDQRWERFKTSDEIFFDLGEFTRVLAT